MKYSMVYLQYILLDSATCFAIFTVVTDLLTGQIQMDQVHMNRLTDARKDGWTGRLTYLLFNTDVINPAKKY